MTELVNLGCVLKPDFESLGYRDMSCVMRIEAADGVFPVHVAGGESGY